MFQVINFRKNVRNSQNMQVKVQKGTVFPLINAAAFTAKSKFQLLSDGDVYYKMANEINKNGLFQKHVTKDFVITKDCFDVH